MFDLYIIHNCDLKKQAEKQVYIYIYIDIFTRTTTAHIYIQLHGTSEPSSSRKSAPWLRFRWELMDSYGLRSHFEELLTAPPAPAVSAKKRTEKTPSNGFLGRDRPRFTVFKWNVPGNHFPEMINVRPVRLRLVCQRESPSKHAD